MMYHVSSSNLSELSDLTDISLADKVSDALPIIGAWVPPMPLMDWDDTLQSMHFAAAQTGFARYNSWHGEFIKRQAEDKEKASSVGSIKRPRVAR
jgi:hypothetical protein